MQHGPEFVAGSALSSFAANAATGLFLIVYGKLGGSMSPWRGLRTAVLAWLGACLATHQFAWTPAMALMLNLGVYGVGFRLLGTGGTQPQAPPSLRRGRLDLPLRAVAVAGFVSLVVAVSSILGPEATGIAAVFPISLISLIVIVRPRIGGAASSLLAANALRSMLGFGIALLALHLMVKPWGAAGAILIALLVSACWSAALLLLRNAFSVATRTTRASDQAPPVRIPHQ